jgi:hypothetical protein
VPLVGDPAGAGEQAEAVVEPFGDLAGGQGAGPCRGQLDRQRHAVQAPAQLGHGGDRRPVGGPVRVGRGRPLQEQRHGRRGHDGLEIGVGLGDRQRRHLVHGLLRQPQRLAAGGQHLDRRTRGEQPLDERGDGVQHVLAVVEQEQQRAGRQQLQDRLLHRTSLLGLHAELGGDGGNDAGLGAHRRQLHHGQGQARAVRDPAGGPTGQLRLADATRPDQGDQAASSAEVLDERHVAVAADELDRARGRAEPRRTRRRVGATAGRLRVGGHRPFQGDELGRRVEAEVLAQPGAVAARGPQRIALAAGSVQGEEHRPPGLLAPRMLDGECLGVAGRPLVETEGQQRGEALLAGVQAQLGQPRHLGEEPRLVGELGERLAAPLGQRGIEVRHRVGGGGGERRPTGGEARFEAVDVGRHGGDDEPVPGRLGHQPGARGQHPPQPGDVGLQRGQAGVGHVIAPHHVHQTSGAHHRAAVQDERGQQPARLLTPDRHRFAVDADRDGTEGPQHGQVTWLCPHAASSHRSTTSILARRSPAPAVRCRSRAATLQAVGRRLPA